MFSPEIKNILEKVCGLYQKYGIKSVSMNDVAKELGISKKTLYQHFKDKEELVKKTNELLSEKQKCSFLLIKSKQLNAIEELLEVFEHVSLMMKNYNFSMEYDLKKYYPDLYLSNTMTHLNQIYTSILDNINQGIKEGLYREDMTPDIIAKIYVSRIEGLHNSQFITIEDISVPNFFKELFTYHLRGICSEKGLQFLQQHLTHHHAK